MSRRKEITQSARATAAMKRRTFLTVTGGVAAAAALRPSAAMAQGAAQPKRLLIIFTPDGTLHNQWRPTGSATDFTLPHILKPFESLRDDLLVLDGIDNKIYGMGDGDAHEQGMTQMLTGRPNKTTAATSTGMSIDEYVHQNISDGRPALRVGVGGNPNYISNWTRMTYDQNGSAIHPRQSPYQARDAMFPAGFSPGGTGSTGPTQAELRARAIRGGALGFASSQLAGMAGKLRNLDQQRLLSHAGSLSSFAQSESEPTPEPTVDHTALYQRVQNWTPGLVATHKEQAKFPEVARMQMELISAAFAFDRSRVAVLQFSQSNSAIAHTWAGAPAGVTHHGLSHDGKDAELLKIYRWYSEQIAWLANDLKTNGLLENTTILWMSEMQTGENHGQTTIPMTIIGGANHFQTGRYMNYRSSGGFRTPACSPRSRTRWGFPTRSSAPATTARSAA
jgi:hypothetical protein